MCFSAEVRQKIRELEKSYRAYFDYGQTETILQRRMVDSSLRISRAFEANFDLPQTPEERRIKELISEYRAQSVKEWEQELFAQKKRLADAQRSLQTKETKKALNVERIATKKIKYFVDKLTDLKRTELKPKDSRIFPLHYAPIVIRENNENKIVLARYHCRQQGKPASYDERYPGLYNARRDNLEAFWRNEFGHTHAVMVINSFFENVALNYLEHRELKPDELPTNVVLHFTPRPAYAMQVACIYSRWTDPKTDEELISFAAITDEPTPEIAAAGHNRCVIDLKQENVDIWLSPQHRSTAELQTILSDRSPPYFEHERVAA